MTVAELIGKLSTFPQDAVVLYRACSDWSTMDEKDVTLHKPEDRQIIYREHKHGDGYSDFNPRWVPPGKEGEPEYNDFRTLVCFPGN